MLARNSWVIIIMVAILNGKYVVEIFFGVCSHFNGIHRLVLALVYIIINLKVSPQANCILHFLVGERGG